MASKVTALTATTALADTDLIYAVYDVAGTPVSRKVTVSALKAILRGALNLPVGYLINGYISVTVASNNLTVAIKTLAGADPSATDPVYIRIGNTVRSITAALSVTKNAGTNWCNAGGTELATKEIDYFVYIGYNATDGVVIGFSRVPYGTTYSSFSATSTAETYCAISTITNAAAGDEYQVIGRFAATLSAGAGYTWSVPTFTPLNLIQHPIYDTRRLYWAPTLTGYSANPTNAVYEYYISGRICELSIREAASGTSNLTTLTLTLPMVAATLTDMIWTGTGSGLDNSAALTTPVRLDISSASSTIDAYPNFAAGSTWTASGAKRIAAVNIRYAIG